ncbi:microtubule-associated tumor suppressor 1 homolog A isoform X2 [Phyllopteryx taeniolatus]|uniref:microtubule-associated tumor suppressor 1 homolog A isoform X2 n=1 Tax=Phyllopteryx taeniolatus TaxID=161469 RepID=UPI002AD48CAB|nr:microtubule-associated tumor suppressor 1 homolog A isoform X2 [Phyllopteryx taeniolatus]
MCFQNLKILPCQSPSMFNSTFNLSYNTPHKDMHLCLTAESSCNNVSLSPSLESSNTIANIDGEAGSSLDINMLDSFQSKALLVNNFQSTSLLDDNSFCNTTMSLYQACIPTTLDNHADFCNTSLSAQGNQDTKESQSFNLTKRNAWDSIMTSSDSAAEGQLISCETSRRGSIENASCSMSSGEMLLRKNSFCLADQSPLVFSSLDESSISPSAGHAALHNESNILTTPTLSDLCEKNTENSGHPYLGMTFTLSDNCELAVEADSLSVATFPMVMPAENHGGLQITFVCEDTQDNKKQLPLTCVESEPLGHLLGGVTPEKCITFVPSLSTIQDRDKDGQTSTPVLNIGGKILPSFSESLCSENACSPILFHNEQHHTSVTPTKHCVVGLFPSARKVKKMEINVPKSELSYINSKALTRTVHKTIESGSSPQQKQIQTNVLRKCTERPSGTSRVSPTKVRNNNAFASVSTKRANNAQRQVNSKAAQLPVATIQSPEKTLGSGKCNSSMSTGAMKSAPVAQCSKASTDMEQTTLSKVADPPAQCASNQTFYSSSLEKSPDKSFQKDQKPTPKKNASNKIEIKSASALRQAKTRPRCSSESLPSSRPPRERNTVSKLSTPITISRHEKRTKSVTLNNSSQSKLTSPTESSKRPAVSYPREVNRISLVTYSGRAGNASSENSRNRGQTFPNQPRGTYVSHPPVASPRPSTQSIRERPGTNYAVDFRVSKHVGTPQSKQNSIAGSQRTPTTKEPVSAESVKPQLNVSKPPQAPLRPSCMGPLPSPVSRLPRKTVVTSRSRNKESIHSNQDGTARTQVSGLAAHKQTPVKTVVLKARVIPTPGRWTGPTTTNTPATNANKGTSTLSPLKRTAASRYVRQTPRKAVENKPKTSCRQQVSTSQTKQNTGPPDVVPPILPRDDRNKQRIHNLGRLLAASNCRFEAITIILQQTLAERDEATEQCRELSQELVNLRGELVCSVSSSEQLEKEKQDLQDGLECAMGRLHEQHQKDLEEMEQRLQVFYQAECDKGHLSYQEEADKVKALLQKQMEHLEVSHDATKLELEHCQVEQLQCVKQQHEQSLEELRKSHTLQLESLNASLKDAEAALSARIQVLTQENADLMEKLTAEENKLSELSESQDSHTLYLEQELESLKVVLDIKNKQLHQQQEKIIKIDELLEKNVKLDEGLKKVQQENEDLKARMEKYATLSRKLSTEQAVLQESLQKESKVNKRLSRENEELLWKLQNSDPSSPLKVSPNTSTSPSHSFSFQSSSCSSACSVLPLSHR